MHTAQREKLPCYSALFTLLDCMDLSPERDSKIITAVVNVTRKLATVGFGSNARLSVSAVLLIRLHSGVACTGDADSKGWKRLVIETGKHRIEITP